MPQSLTKIVGSFLAGCTLAWTQAGCAMELPAADLILDERPLALRIEASTDPARAEVLPFETVRIRPWIVDTFGPLSPEAIERDMEPLWLACALPPFAGVFSCLSSKLPLEPAMIPLCPAVDISQLDPTMLEAGPSPCRIQAEPAAEPTYTIPLDPAFLIGGAVEVTMIAHRPGRGSSEHCLRELVTQAERIPEECLLTSQRISIGPRSSIYEAAAALGVSLGAPPPISEPDRHPQIATFAVQVFTKDPQQPAPIVLTERGQTIVAPLGSRLELMTSAPESDLQTYYTTGDEGLWIEQREAYQGRWYRTWGTLWNSQSDDPRSLNRWELVQGDQDDLELPEGGRATLYYTLRDGRQGVDTWWFHVMVTP